MSARTHREGISSNPKDRIGATKVPLSLIPMTAQIHAALAHFDGSLKYGPFNWREEDVAATIYVDAALRHILKWFDREQEDADSGIHHLGHAVACLNILMDAEACGNMIDDRPLSSAAAQMLDRAREEVIRLIKLRGKDVPSTPPINQEVTGVIFNNEGPPQVYRSPPIVPGPEKREATGCCAPSIYEDQPPLVTDKTVHVPDDDRITHTECILGHAVSFIDERCGYIDGEYLQGTAFSRLVKLYKDGFQNIDEAMEAQYAKERDDREFAETRASR